MFKNLSASALAITGHQSEIIELALTYGFRGIDVNIQEFTTRVKDHGMPYARRLIDSARLQVGRFQLPCSWEVKDADFEKELNHLAAAAAAAAEIGCTRCLATIEPAGDERPYHENFEFHRQRFSEICKKLLPAEVRLGLGFRATEKLRKGNAFQFIHDFDALSTLVKMVAEPNVGILLDVWELYVSGGSIDNIRGLNAEQIVAVQLADLPSDEPLDAVTEADRLLPGATGRIDSTAILALLKEKGYDGPVTIKASRRAFTTSRRDEIVRQAGGALDTVWHAAGLPSEPRFSPRSAG